MTGFGPDHLPYGAFALPARADHRALGVRLGDQVVDVAALAEAGQLPHPQVLATARSLDPLLAAGPVVWHEVRAALQDLLAGGTERLPGRVVHELADVRLHLPFTVADYVDFYSFRDHATNVGRMFRPDGEALLLNWLHLPVGYHGRAGTVVVSGTDVVRPSGQRRGPGGAIEFGPSVRLDVEAELAFVVGTPSRLGVPVPAADFTRHVFGVALLNDWSARDIQAWEYVPLGPFLAKSFATSLAAWVTPLAALESARVAPVAQDPPPLPYLVDDDPWALDLTLDLAVNGTVVSHPPMAAMYWTPGQQLAHLTGSGAALRTGDIYASGTVSGPEREQRGCLLELTWDGTEPVTLADGSTRSFLADGDVVRITAHGRGTGGGRLELGEVTGRILPARSGG